MSPQIVMTEVNTDIPFKQSINISFPWFVENSSIDSPQIEPPITTSGDGRVSYWAEMADPHLNGEDDPIPITVYPYTNDQIQIDKVDTLTNMLENFLAQKFLIIPEVEFVLFSLENDSIDIWTVINKLDREVRQAIYDVEYEILDLIKEFHFDFHVICRNDRNIKEIYPLNARMIFQK